MTTQSEHWKQARADFHAAQTGLCAICGNPLPLRQAQLDHCHVTGMIRGVLCRSCNVKLGWYEKRRREIEPYLAHAAVHAAHRKPHSRRGPGRPRSRPVMQVVARPLPRSREWLRRYYLAKAQPTPLRQ